ncbi:hypothetical protein [Nostoc sp.]
MGKPEQIAANSAILKTHRIKRSHPQFKMILASPTKTLTGQQRKPYRLSVLWLSWLRK